MMRNNTLPAARSKEMRRCHPHASASGAGARLDLRQIGRPTGYMVFTAYSKCMAPA
jgi:hypothetical protein